jgi:YD repeat-containing protein
MKNELEGVRDKAAGFQFRFLLQAVGVTAFNDQYHRPAGLNRGYKLRARIREHFLVFPIANECRPSQCIRRGGGAMRFYPIGAVFAGACLFATAAVAETSVYDDLGRLTTGTADNGQHATYTYDQAGNRAQVAGGTANLPPIARRDMISVDENSFVTFDPRVNDTDPENDPLTIATSTNGAHGTVAIVSGGLKYTPTTGYYGADAFTYQISDGQGHTSPQTSVAVTVNRVNRPPHAIDHQYNIPRNLSYNFDPRAGATDQDNDPLTITGTGVPKVGTVVINSGTSLTYTPPSGYSGADSFGYTISDGQGHTAAANIAITVTSANQPPEAQNDGLLVKCTLYHYTDTCDGGPSCNADPNHPGNCLRNGLDPTINDSDPDYDPLTVTEAHDNGTKGTATVSGNTVTYAFNGSVTGTDLDQTDKWHDTDTVTYTISDGHGGTAQATINVQLLVVLSLQ